MAILRGSGARNSLIELLLVLIHLFYSAISSRETKDLYIYLYFKDIDLYGRQKDIIEAETGEEGLEKYKSEKPDLVLLDLRLPGMDGIECFKELKKINSGIKVIIVSIVTRKDSIDECMKLGAKAYLIKPVTQNKLIEPIKKVLG